MLALVKDWLYVKGLATQSGGATVVSYWCEAVLRALKSALKGYTKDAIIIVIVSFTYYYNWSKNK